MTGAELLSRHFLSFLKKITLHSNHSLPPSSLPYPTLTNPSPHYPLLFSSEKESLFGYHTSLELLVPADVGTTSPTEAHPGSPSRRERDPMSGDRDLAPDPLVRGNTGAPRWIFATDMQGV